jgi:leader peptidase (prepilin peptidase) / N-methyltransferase
MNYVVILIFSLIIGQVVGHLNKKLPPVVSEEITYKEFFSSFKYDFKLDIKYSFILIVYGILLNILIGFNLNSLLYFILGANLLIIFSVDFRYQLIPDECHIVIIIIAIINLLNNINLWYSYLIGAIAGGLVFYILNILALIIFKKEGMGFGDIKLMASLGLLFGFKSILVITLISFFLGAIIGGILIIINRKKFDNYMPFGPFIVISTILIIFINPNEIINIYYNMCLALSNLINDSVYYILGGTK